ncbi:MAG TPA: NIPSNAP family protein [Puia sp.]|nr:NIPSNAP family protein [Puia sp.]
MKKFYAGFTAFILMNTFCVISYAQNDIYELLVYKLKTADQITATDNYLKDAYIPAMHRLGIRQIGVFKPMANDTSEIKKIIVLVQYISLDVWQRTKTNILNDAVYTAAAKPFRDADTANLPFARVESTIMEAFPDAPKLIPTTLISNPDAIYELRSYESPTEELHRIKVNMFNTGGEVALFKRLDFQAVFYSDVLSGGRMPNLIYMVAFANTAAREEHWKAFGSSPEWKKISVDPIYRNNVSVNHIDSWILKRTSYSDL